MTHGEPRGQAYTRMVFRHGVEGSEDRLGRALASATQTETGRSSHPSGVCNPQKIMKRSIVKNKRPSLWWRGGGGAAQQYRE